MLDRPGALASMTAGTPGSFNRLDRQGNRALLARWFLRGTGIEVGALHNPLWVPPGVNVLYVDRFPTKMLREHYPELNSQPLVEPDIIDDGQELSTLAPSSQDFVIANHFIEHCEDPIKTIRNFLRVLKPGGVLYLAIPDKTETFDRDRAITPFTHLVEDHEQTPEISRRDHYLEWAHLVDKAPAGEPQTQRADHLMQLNYSIHFHVWDKPATMDFIYNLRHHMGLQFQPTLFLDNGEEAVWILTK